MPPARTPAPSSPPKAFINDPRFDAGGVGEWDTSRVKTLAQTFEGAAAFNQNVGAWDTSRVTTLHQTFFGAAAFNQELAGWDVTAVVTMHRTFRSAAAFTSDLSGWGVSSTTSLYATFSECGAFNSDLSRWAVGKATTMSYLFYEAVSFDSDLARWNVRGALGKGMAATFKGATSFTGAGLNAWDVSAIQDFGQTFSEATALADRVDLSAWDLAGATAMTYMFCSAETVHPNIDTWDTSSVRDFLMAFYGNPAFNADVSRWDVSSATQMSKAFKLCGEFRSDVARWDVSSVTDMSFMFEGAFLLDSDVSRWDVGSVTDMSDMFREAHAFDSALSDWSVSGVTDMYGMFYHATRFNGGVSRWDVSSVTNLGAMFSKAAAFNQNIAAWDVSAAVLVEDIFSGAASFRSDLSRWNATLPTGADRGRLGYLAADSRLDTRALVLADESHGDGGAGSTGQKEPRQYLLYTGSLYAVPGPAGLQPAGGGAGPATTLVDLAGNPRATASFNVAVEPKTNNVFVDKETGQWRIATSSDQVGTIFTATLSAFGASGMGVELKAWSFAVQDRPALALTSPSDAFLNTTNGYRSVFAVGESYSCQAPPPGLVAGGTGTRVYAMEIHLAANATGTAGNVALALGQQPGKWFVDGKGETLAEPAIVELDGGTDEYTRQYEGRLTVRDEAGSSIVVKQWVFRVLRRDVDVDAYGPGGAGCGAGAKVDGVPFDKAFTCDCAGTKFTGRSCAVLAASSGQDGTAADATTAVLVVLVLSAAAALVLVRYHRWKRAMVATDFSAQLQTMMLQGEVDEDQTLEGRVPRELKRGWLSLVDKLGHGAFGDVWKGLLKDGASPGVPEYMVAVKVVKQATDSLDTAGFAAAEEELLKEALLMAQVETHPHLVALVGVITRGKPKVLILSFCEHGELQGKLKKRAADGNAFSTTERYRLCKEVADGMAHLARHNFVHRDLAARNVLLGSGMVCKVADFGLSRQVQTEDNAGDYYRSSSGIIPVRWTAPEGMSSLKFSSASDVWSYGITCVEIFQDGAFPYPEVRSNPDVMKMVCTQGYVHPQPKGCSAGVYAELVKCWSFEPSQRPEFAELKRFFAGAITSAEPKADTPSNVEAAHARVPGVARDDPTYLAWAPGDAEGARCVATSQPVC